MCGRYQLDIDNRDSFIERFHIEGTIPKKLQSSWNIAPSQEELVILSQSPNHIEMMEWGLIPFWEKSDKPKGLINIRDDSIKNKKWAHKYIQFQRCIIPATGFYEWKKTKEGKVPYCIRLKSKAYFGMAGLYADWTHPKTNENIRAYAIITTSPNDVMKDIHNRMPVILEKSDEDDWLNPDNVEVENMVKYLKPFSHNDLEAFPISTRINSPTFNSPDAVQHVENHEIR